VNTKANKFLHYVLIILMMFAPASGSLAAQSSHCDMSNMSSMNSELMDSDSSHQGHALQTEKNNCCDTDNCASNCDMGMTVSLFIQTSSYSPVFLAVTESVALSTEVLIRSLAPPSRPPADLS